MTLEHENQQKKALEEYAEFSREIAMKLKDFDIEVFHNKTLKRMIRKITDIGDAILDPEEFSELKSAIMNMKNTYAKAKIPSFKDGKILYSLEPEIANVLESSRDPNELKYYWEKWYDLTGKPNRNDFWKYVELRNLAAVDNGKIDNDKTTFT